MREYGAGFTFTAGWGYDRLVFRYCTFPFNAGLALGTRYPEISSIEYGAQRVTPSGVQRITPSGVQGMTLLEGTDNYQSRFG